MKTRTHLAFITATVAVLSTIGLAAGTTSAQADVSVGDPGSTWYVVWKNSDPFFVNFPNVDNPVEGAGRGSSVCLAPVPCRHEGPLPGTTPLGGNPIIIKKVPPASK